MPLDPLRFRETMGSLVAGVTIVAARDPLGKLRGMTASSVTSLSLEPPMLLVCVGHDAEIHDTLVGSPLFTVSVLAEGQDRLAERFATRGTQHFDEVDSGVTPGGLPVIAGAIAQLECRRDAVHSVGDHTIVTGVIEWAATREGPPLCHFHSRYVGLAR